MKNENSEETAQALNRIEKLLKVLLVLVGYIAVVVSFLGIGFSFPILQVGTGVLILIGLLLFGCIYLMYLVFGGIGYGLGKLICFFRKD